MGRRKGDSAAREKREERERASERATVGARTRKESEEQ